MGNHHERSSQGSSPSNGESATASCQEPERTARLRVNEHHHSFGGVAFGEHAAADVAIPENHGLADAMVNVSLAGAGFTTDVSGPWMKVGPGAASTALRVRFSPQHSGHHEGRIDVTARWADGHVERVTITLDALSTTPGDEIFRDPAPARRLSELQPVNLGEQVVGSTHRFNVASPANLGRQSATVALSYQGDDGINAAWASGTVKQVLGDSAAEPICLRFAPSDVGTFAGQLRLFADWQDGHRENQTVPVVGAARRMSDAPATHINTSAATAASPHESDAWRDEAVTKGYDRDRELFTSVLDESFRAQIRAVASVERQQDHYTPKPTPQPLWFDLVNAAVTLATGGICGIVEQAILKTIARSTGLMTAKVIGANVPVGSKQLDLFPRTAARSASPRVEVDPKATASRVISGLMTQVKTKTSAAAVKKLQPTVDGSGDPVNEAIEFFTGQTAKLANAQRLAMDAAHIAFAELSLLDHAVPGFSTNLAEATAVESVNAAAFASQEQQRHTSAQFVAFKSRLSLGTEQVKREDGAATVTAIAKTAQFDRLETPKGGSADGVLTVSIELREGAPRITGARVNGIAWRVTEHLLSANLREENIPVRFVINDGAAVITRDEAGRVRYGGVIHLDPDEKVGTAVVEVQELRAAQLLVDSVLARTLAAWGLESIDTDDTDKRVSSRKEAP